MKNELFQDCEPTGLGTNHQEASILIADSMIPQNVLDFHKHSILIL